MFCHHFQPISVLQSNTETQIQNQGFLGPLDINAQDYPKYDTGGSPTLSLILALLLELGNE
jgi:hypothetical protein